MWGEGPPRALGGSVAGAVDHRGADRGAFRRTFRGADRGADSGPARSRRRPRSPGLLERDQGRTGRRVPARPRVDPLGSRQLTDGTARAFDPDLSPDGASVVYRVNPDPSSDAADLWLLGTDASVPRNLTSDPSLHNWSPAWSPDGSRIAFASTREGGTLRVWTMAPDGSDVRRVTDGHGEYPDWSPDGRQIVFAAPTTSSGGSYDLWIVPTDGPGTPTRLTATPETEFAPAWSPDGHSIAWQRDAGERWELWVGRADGSAARRVSPSGEDGVWPAWSPDGTLGWSGTAGLSFLDLASGARRSLRPDRRGTDFLDWGR